MGVNQSSDGLQHLLYTLNETNIYIYKQYHENNIPAGTKRLCNVSFRVYLRYVICERFHNVVTTLVNERCFTYV